MNNRVDINPDPQAQHGNAGAFKFQVERINVADIPYDARAEADGGAAGGPVCPICFERYNDATRSPAKTVCGHIVCIECIQSSISMTEPNGNLCPMCRGVLFARNQAEPQAPGGFVGANDPNLEPIPPVPEWTQEHVDDTRAVFIRLTTGNPTDEEFQNMNDTYQGHPYREVYRSYFTLSQYQRLWLLRNLRVTFPTPEEFLPPFLECLLFLTLRHSFRGSHEEIPPLDTFTRLLTSATLIIDETVDDQIMSIRDWLRNWMRDVDMRHNYPAAPLIPGLMIGRRLVKEAFEMALLGLLEDGSGHTIDAVKQQISQVPTREEAEAVLAA